MQKQRALLRGTVSGELKDSDGKAHHPRRTASSESLERLLFDCTHTHARTHACVRANKRDGAYLEVEVRWRSSCLLLLPARWLMSQRETWRGKMHSRGIGVTWECNPRQGEENKHLAEAIRLQRCAWCTRATWKWSALMRVSQSVAVKHQTPLCHIAA